MLPGRTELPEQAAGLRLAFRRLDKGKTNIEISATILSDSMAPHNFLTATLHCIPGRPRNDSNNKNYIVGGNPYLTMYLLFLPGWMSASVAMTSR